IEVFVQTPMEECMARDPKGLYAKARAGQISNFTGLDSPYEEPLSAEIVLPTLEITPEQSAQSVVAKLRELGIVCPGARSVQFDRIVGLYLERGILIFLAQHAVPDHQHVDFSAHKAAERVFRGADNRLAADVEAGVHQDRTSGQLGEAA